MDKASFLKRYGGVYEHSPWIAETAFAAGKMETPEELHAAMREAVAVSGRDRKLALIAAHPDLACAPADAGSLTPSSVSEQKGAGLDRCTPEEYAEFRHLNAAYREKFGFPFIVAVKGMTRADILQAFRTRIQNTPEKEFEAALEQIHKIAGFRLAALFQAP